MSDETQVRTDAASDRPRRLSALAVATLAWGALSAPLMVGLFFLLIALKNIFSTFSFPGVWFIWLFGVQIVAVVATLETIRRVREDASTVYGMKHAIIGTAFSIVSWLPGWYLCLRVSGYCP